MSAKTATAPQAFGPHVGALLTVAELLDHLNRMGADPATTTIRINGVDIAAASLDWSVERERGVTYVDIHFDYLDDLWEV